MRNPERISRITTKLIKLWKMHPQLRLCQLLGNMSTLHLEDMYYLEDKDLEKRIDEALTMWVEENV